MKLKYLFFACLMIAVAFNSCKSDPGISPEEQLAADEIRIKEFIEKNNIPAVRHQTGVYYQIMAPGTGDIVYNANTVITANYTLRFLNGQLVEKSEAPFTSKLGGNPGLIPAWQIAIPLIQKGGKIRIISPSGFAYGRVGQGPIPADAVLDFEIELLNAQN